MPMRIFCLSIALLMWASSYLGNHFAMHAPLGGPDAAPFSPGAAALLRSLVASAVFAVIACWRRPALPERGQRWRPFAAGAAGMAVYNVLLYSGQRTVNPDIASFIVQLSPLFTAVFAHLALGERLRSSAWLGLLISMGGVGLILHPDAGGVRHLSGPAFVLAAALCWAAYHVIQKPALARAGAFAATCYAVWAGSLMLLPYLPDLVRELAHAPLRPVAALIYLGIGPSAFAFLAWGVVLKQSPVTRVAPFLYLIPLLVIGFQIALTTLRPDVFTLIGGTVSIIGVLLVQRAARPVSAP